MVGNEVRDTGGGQIMYLEGLRDTGFYSTRDGKPREGLRAV